MLSARQLDAHYSGIGGSLAPAVLGVDPYKSPLQAYLELINPAARADLSGNESVLFGTVLEEPIAQEAARRLGVKVRRVNRTLRHREHSWMLAHPDRLIIGQRAGLEIKNRSQFKARAYGTEGTDEAEFSELVQCQHYLAVTGYEVWYLAVLIGGNRLRLFTVTRDEDLIDELIRREAAFWRGVTEGIPPEPTTAADLAALYPRDDGGTVVATDATLTAVEALHAVRVQLKELEGHKAALETQIKAALGAHATLLGPNGKPLATYKTRPARRLDSQALKAAAPEVYRQFSIETQTRTLLLK